MVLVVSAKHLQVALMQVLRKTKTSTITTTSSSRPSVDQATIVLPVQDNHNPQHSPLLLNPIIVMHSAPATTKGQPQPQVQASSLEVTIFTHDDMLFADATNVEAHRKGVDKFFKTVHRLVQQKKLHSAQLIVMESSNIHISISVAQVQQHSSSRSSISSDESDGDEDNDNHEQHNSYSRDMTEVKAQALTLITNIQRQL
jgi:hypothetical protein